VSPRGIYYSAQVRTAVFDGAGDLGGNEESTSAEPSFRPCQVAFERREDFQRFVAKYPEVSQGMVR